MRILLKCSIAIICLLSFGCSSPSTPSAANFASAIQKYLEAHPEKSTCVNFNFSVEYPYQLILNPFQSGNVRSATQTLEMLSMLGLVQKTGEGKSKVGSWDMDAIYWDLTDQGRRYFQQGIDRFCFGKIGTVKVKDFSQPANDQGATISTVEFEARVLDVPDWAEKAASMGFPYQVDYSKVEISKPLVGKAQLKLMNSGWQVEFLRF